MEPSVTTRQQSAKQRASISSNRGRKSDAWLQRERVQAEKDAIQKEAAKKRVLKQLQKKQQLLDQKKRAQKEEEDANCYYTINRKKTMAIIKQYQQGIVPEQATVQNQEEEPTTIIQPSALSNNPENQEAPDTEFGRVDSNQSRQGLNLQQHYNPLQTPVDPAVIMHGFQMMLQPLIAQEIQKRSQGSNIALPAQQVAVSQAAVAVNPEESKDDRPNGGNQEPVGHANQDGDQQHEQADRIAKAKAEERLRRLSKLKPQLKAQDRKPRTWQELKAAKESGEMLMRWCELSANCDRVLKTQCILHSQKKAIEDLKKALSQMTGNASVPGYKGLKQVGKYSLFPYRQCETCDALVLTVTRDTHKNSDCSKRGLEGTDIIGTRKRPFCALCLKQFDSVDACRLHMSKYWSEVQLKALGYRAILFKDLQPKGKGQPSATSLSAEAKAALGREKDKNVAQQKKFLDTILGTSDGMLALMRENSQQLSMRTEIHLGSLTVYEGYLSIVTGLKDIRDDFLGDLFGDFLQKALYNHNSVARESYLESERVQKLCFNDEAVLWQTRKFLGTDDSKYQVQRYLDRFKDDAHRCDLAYAMLSLAKRGNEKKVFYQRIYDPDLWYWIESEDDCGVYFSGQMWAFAYERYMLGDERACGMFYNHEFQTQYHVPLMERQNNFEDVLIYALSLNAGAFRHYSQKHGVYLAHKYEPMDTQRILGQQDGMPNRAFVQRAIELMRHQTGKTPEYATTLEIINGIFKPAKYSHTDPEQEFDDMEIQVWNLDPYAYLKDTKFSQRRAVIKETAINGRYVAYEKAGQTLFPRKKDVQK